MHTPWIGAGVVLAAVGLTAWSGRLDRGGCTPALGSGLMPGGAHTMPPSGSRPWVRPQRPP
jgi:hypothetical protein